MTRCAILHCKSENSKQKGESGKIRFHKFPTKNIKLQKEWLAKCKLRAGLNLNKAVLCSLHFRPEDYPTKYKMIDYSSPWQLKPEAVPSRNLHATFQRQDDERHQQSINNFPEEILSSSDESFNDEFEDDV